MEQLMKNFSVLFLSAALLFTFPVSLGAEPVREYVKQSIEWLEDNTELSASFVPDIKLVSQEYLQHVLYGRDRQSEGFTVEGLVHNDTIYINEDIDLRYLENIIFHETVHVMQGPPNNERHLSCQELEAYTLEHIWAQTQPQGEEPHQDPMIVFSHKIHCHVGRMP